MPFNISNEPVYVLVPAVLVSLIFCYYLFIYVIIPSWKVWRCVCDMVQVVILLILASVVVLLWYSYSQIMTTVTDSYKVIEKINELKPKNF
jgi:hypothetical protein